MKRTTLLPQSNNKTTRGDFDNIEYIYILYIRVFYILIRGIICDFTVICYQCYHNNIIINIYLYNYYHDHHSSDDRILSSSHVASSAHVHSTTATSFPQEYCPILTFLTSFDNRLRVWLHVERRFCSTQLYRFIYDNIIIVIYRYAWISKHVYSNNSVRDDVLTFPAVLMFDYYCDLWWPLTSILHRYWCVVLDLLGYYTMAAKIQPFDPPSSASSDR